MDASSNLNDGPTFVTVSVPSLLSFAYDVPANPSPRLSGLPNWSLERYDIEAKAGAHTTTSGLSSKDTLHRTQQMTLSCSLSASAGRVRPANHTPALNRGNGGSINGASELISGTKFYG